MQLVGGADPGSGGQSDATPQPVYPKWYYKRVIALYPVIYTRYLRQYSKYPHPVLRGPLGVIDVFPDHAHEGDCVLPQDDILQIPTSAGNTAEYPGTPVRPEIIAQARNVVGRTKSGYTIVDPRPFGLLGVYDRHDVAGQTIGRVLVDATWHHWFDVNLFGIEAGASAADGSDDSDNWRQIQAFFCNCAVWLAPKGRQRAMRLAGKLLISFAYPIVKENGSWVLRAELDKRLLLYVGKYSLGALEKVTGRCGRVTWIYDFIELIELDRFSRIPPEIIAGIRPIPLAEPPSDFEEVIEARVPVATATDIVEEVLLPTLFGAAMLALWKEHAATTVAGNTGRSDDPDQEIERSVKLMRAAAEEALPVALKLASEQQAQLARNCETIQSAYAKLGL